MKLNKIKLNGLDFRYRDDDKYIGQRVALGKYEEYETKLMLSQLNNNSVVVDVGANIGYYTLLLSQKCKMVYAFEPDKKCFEILKKNVEKNNLGNVKLFNIGISDKEEKKYLIRDEDNLGNSKINPSKSPFNKGDLQPANCERLDDILINEHKIDLIKIDTQGWEPQVIEGAKKIIKRDSPTLFLEYTPSEYKDKSMINFLRGIYKNIWSIDYWYYFCRNGINVSKKTGYVDLFLKNKITLGDWINKYKYLKIKKVIRSIMNYGKN
ncbi:MAG: FkbM family methyltransferase [Microgenomates group bacterium]